MIEEKFDDAIAGAGIIGLAHAYQLARRGRRVVVFERNPRAMGASVRNFGMLWPIGQPTGFMHKMALRSRAFWRNILQDSGLWHEQTGSLHLAYYDDEAQVLREFVAQSEANGFDCELWEADAILSRARGIHPDGLCLGMWSPTEICVDPRQVIAGLPAYLHDKFGVAFHFNCAVTAYAQPTVTAGGKTWQASRLWVCGGDDFQTLYPDTLQNLGLVRCKLQMMRSQPYDGAFHIGPMLAAGLTLRHYKSFADCPTLRAVKERVARETPEFDRYGIHVLVSQNGQGEIVIGDSHLYEDQANDQNGDQENGIGPFDDPQIDGLILDYLNTFLRVPDLRIASRWHGVYAKHPTEPFTIAHPAPGATAIVGVGGAGMTLSFGLADHVVTEV
jgi:FAD dependent oxidoreductase TIGR03364